MNHAFSALVHAPRTVLVFTVKAYRLLVSPSLGSNCRFIPSCSAYAIEALGQHGAVAGSYLTLRRLVRCQPWCDGGHDPVPPPPSASFFSRLCKQPASISSKKTPS